MSARRASGAVSSACFELQPNGSPFAGSPHSSRREVGNLPVLHTTERGEFVAKDGLFLTHEQRAEYDHDAAHEYMLPYEEATDG